MVEEANKAHREQCPGRCADDPDPHHGLLLRKLPFSPHMKARCCGGRLASRWRFCGDLTAGHLHLLSTTSAPGVRSRNLGWPHAGGERASGSTCSHGGGLPRPAAPQPRRWMKMREPPCQAAGEAAGSFVVDWELAAVPGDMRARSDRARGSQ